MLKSEKEILGLPGESDEIFRSGIVEYYMMRPNQDDMKNVWQCLLLIILNQQKLKMIISRIVSLMMQQ